MNIIEAAPAKSSIDELEESSIALHLQGRSRTEIIDELLEAAARSLKLVDPEAAREAVLRRERLAGSGWHNGVAIPHARTEAVSDLLVVLGVSDEAVDFQAYDGEPCRIFLLTLAPARCAGAQLDFAARIESRLRDEEVREALLGAWSGVDVLKALSISSAG